MTIDINSKLSIGENIVFRKREHCINCNSSNLNPLWQGKFADEPTRTYIQKCNYSEDLIKHLGEETFSLVSCQNCGTTFHKHILTPEFLNVLYSEWINDAQINHLEAEIRTGTKTDSSFMGSQQLIKHLLRLQKFRKQFESEEFRILDYGCGDGNFLIFAKLLGFQTYGIDFSSTRQERAAQAGIAVFNNLENLSTYQVDKMHCVTLFQVLEHLDKPLLVLNEIANIMEDEGILIVEVPNCRGITQPQNFSEFSYVHPLEHINAFTPQTLKKICSRAGFVPIKRIPAHATTSFIDVIRTEMSRFIRRNSTSMYFKLCKSR
ncbi:MAG: class I SAM-dependent methyltransferase [Rivularia sp. (in: cyanobacteria)]